MFRLELLENIFSLLFLSTADLAQQKDPPSNTGNVTQSDLLSNTNRDSDNKYKACEVENGVKENQKQSSSPVKKAPSHYLDLGHLVLGCRGFLVDVMAVEGFLKLLKEGLEGMRVGGQQTGGAVAEEAEGAERMGYSVRPETFGTRLQRLSKHIAEAQWRLQIITSNQGGGSGEKNRPKMFFPFSCFLFENMSFFSFSGLESPVQMSGLRSPFTSVGRSKSSSLRRRKRAGRRSVERQASMEKHHGEGSTSPSGENLQALSVTFCLPGC